MIDLGDGLMVEEQRLRELAREEAEENLKEIEENENVRKGE